MQLCFLRAIRSAENSWGQSWLLRGSSRDFYEARFGERPRWRLGGLSRQDLGPAVGFAFQFCVSFGS